MYPVPRPRCWTYILFLVAVATTPTTAYTWPNPKLDELESLLYDRQGHNARYPAAGLSPTCTTFSPSPDDASYPVNVGDWNTNIDDALKRTIKLATFSNRYVSLSDSIALSTVTALEMCGDLAIPFRGGRVDAKRTKIPGGFGKYATALTHHAFTPEETVQLATCLHDFGYLQHQRSLASRHQEPSNDGPGQTVLMKDGLQEPLKDNIQAPHFFLDAANPRNACAELFTRMIDTVPKGVNLSETIEPLPVKPVGLQLTWLGHGNMRLSGKIRLWDMKPNPEREVELHWKARDGSMSPTFSALLSHNPDHISRSLIPNSPPYTSLWYDIRLAPIDADSSISQLWLEIDEGDGSTKRIEDQNGLGFSVQDAIMLTNSTCLDLSGEDTVLVLEVAIRADLKPKQVYIQFDSLDITGSPTLESFRLPTPARRIVDSGYVLWNAAFKHSDLPWTVAVDVGSRTYETVYLGEGSRSLNRTLPVCLFDEKAQFAILSAQAY
ncbi:hypothetical protein EIP91_003807 [Steccherinum ochraceum]|uniref:Uncharacterized protein n=1 Tax=Steccherinum ochraceum TaxID=92696 RepID=A0A4V2MW30_9APHY|nr:hypothetical protein EIP91_003807 [Steccherinum ochraceum]